MNVRVRLALAFAFCAAPLTALGDDARPALLCGGVEPFWSLELGTEGALFSTPDRQIDYTIPDERPALGRFWPRALTLIAPADTAIAILRPETCGDTMSDIEFDWMIDLLTQERGEAVMFTGCCRAAPED